MEFEIVLFYDNKKPYYTLFVDGKVIRLKQVSESDSLDTEKHEKEVTKIRIWANKMINSKLGHIYIKNLKRS